MSDLKRNAHRRLHTFAAPLFAQRVLRRHDPTAAAAVNILFPRERETPSDGERGVTERTTVLGAFTAPGSWGGEEEGRRYLLRGRQFDQAAKSGGGTSDGAIQVCVWGGNIGVNSSPPAHVLPPHAATLFPSSSLLRFRGDQDLEDAPLPAPSSRLLRASGFLQQVAQTFALAHVEVRPLFIAPGKRGKENRVKKKRKCQNPPPALLYLSFLAHIYIKLHQPPTLSPLPCLLFTLAVPLLVAMA